MSTKHVSRGGVFVYAAVSVAVCALALPAPAQHVVPAETFAAIASEISGELAQENTREIVLHHRIQGSPMMAVVAERVLAKLKAAGLEASLDQYISDGTRRYGTFISPMGWDMRGGELWVTKASEPGFAPFRICRYDDVPMCVSSYSRGGDWTGELVEVGSGTGDRDYQGKDVKGKVVLAHGYAGSVVREAVVKRGALGAVIYPSPGDRADHPDMIRYNGIWPRADELTKTGGSFQISQNQYTHLKALLAGGAVTVRGKIDATLAPGKLTLVHAYIRGTEEPEKEVVLTAHLDHPKWSANDNASGSGALLEIARVLDGLVKSGRLPKPRRTLHFIWVPEFHGTVAWLAAHPEARRCGAWDDPRPAPAKGCVLANLNLDMVGEDTVKTNGRFYVTKTPSSVPSFLDALLLDVLLQTREANLFAPTGTRNHWGPEQIPYAQGSDHDLFIGLGVPASMLGHDPDWTHHTSEDTIDKTDASEFRRVSVLSTAAAYWLASAGPEEWKRLAPRVSAAHARDAATRLAGLPPATSPARQKTAADLAQRLEKASAALHSRPGETSGPETLMQPLDPASAAPSKGPRRLTLLPIDPNVFEAMSADDARWWHAQEDSIGGGSRESLGIGTSMDLVSFEAVNFMDGKRSTADIAAALNAEFALELDAAWVERFAKVMANLKLVALP